MLLLSVQVLHEYQRRDGLMQQLLSERDEMRRSSRRTNTESSKLERERDDAVKAAAKLKVRCSHQAVQEPTGGWGGQVHTVPLLLQR
jgi:hypothetical protein